jgi:hypothetical protein
MIDPLFLKAVITIGGLAMILGATGMGVDSWWKGRYVLSCLCWFEVAMIYTGIVKAWIHLK